MTHLIALDRVTKEYGALRALSELSLSLAPGRVHALLGENGAGKSTALKILAGLEHPSSGTVLLDGQPISFGGRTAAIRAGIGLVAQQLSLVPELTVAENLILTRRSLLTRRREAARELAAASEAAGLQIDPRAPVSTLTFAQRQLGELAIALAQGARVLLLDEPTSAIGPYETGRLFERVRALADSGAAVLLITHRVEDVRAIADDVTVLSRGTTTLQARVQDVGDDELVHAIVDHVPAAAQRESAGVGEVRLALDAVTTAATQGRPLREVSLRVHAREILGVLGVAGNGQDTLARVAAGAAAVVSGTVSIDGVAFTGDPARAQRHGVAYIPEERATALLPDRPVWASALATAVRRPEYRRRGGLIDRREVQRRTARLLDDFDVRPRDPQAATASLSGGNQQKLLLGRELVQSPSAIVLHGPTQGLDLYASAQVRNDIRRAADDGAAVLLISADVDEVLGIADRVAVIAGGRIVDSFATSDYDPLRVGRAMAGLGAA